MNVLWEPQTASLWHCSSISGTIGQASRKVTSAWPNQKPALNRAATTGALLFRIRCPMDGSLALVIGNSLALFGKVGGP